jgi:host factor-I protein
MNRQQVNLQDTFLNQVRKENISVTIYLVNGIKLTGQVRGFDSFTVLLDSMGKPTQLVYKHAITSVVPMRPIPNIYQEASREAAGEDGDSDERPGIRPLDTIEVARG